jgi:deoxyadenosine/deoxycytidine kinase
MRHTKLPAVLVECAGPSGSGKSTFIKMLIGELKQPVSVVHTGLDLHNKILPRFLADLQQQNWKADLFLVGWFCIFVMRYPGFSFFSAQTIFLEKDSLKHKVAKFRSFLRKSGIFCYAKSKKFRGHIFLVDEGLIQTAHNFLVTPGKNTSLSLTKEFVEKVPLPDHVVYFMEAPDELIRRLLKRGKLSPRVSDDESLKMFVKEAFNMFSIMFSSPRLKNILLNSKDLQLTESLELKRRSR